MIEISFNKNKIINLIIISFVLIFIGIGLEWISNSLKINNRNLNFARFIGIIIIILGTLGIIVNYRKSKLNCPGFIINQDGILDNSSNLNIGLIEWEDITEISLIIDQGNKFIVIHVRNNNVYINGNLLQETLLSFNANYYKSPIVITTNTLDVEPDKLHSILLENYKLHKVTNN